MKVTRTTTEILPLMLEVLQSFSDVELKLSLRKEPSKSGTDSYGEARFSNIFYELFSQSNHWTCFVSGLRASRSSISN